MVLGEIHFFHFGGVLGSILAPCFALFDALGPSWWTLGGVVGVLWVLLGASGALLGDLVGALGVPWGLPWPSWGPPGWIREDFDLQNHQN